MDGIDGDDGSSGSGGYHGYDSSLLVTKRMYILYIYLVFRRVIFVNVQLSLQPTLCAFNGTLLQCYFYTPLADLLVKY